MPDNQFFSFTELIEVPVRTSVKTADVKIELLSKLVDVFESYGIPNNPKRIRLREKSGDDKLTQVYHDARELSRYHMYDGKEIAIQIMPEEEAEEAN